MTDTPKRLNGPALLTGSGVTLYTVPSSTTTVVRSIHCVNVSGSAATLTLGIGGVTNALSIYFTYSIAALGVLDWSGFLTLAAAETIQGLASATSALTLTISGIEIS
jgi:hypothetical protein